MNLTHIKVILRLDTNSDTRVEHENPVIKKKKVPRTGQRVRDSSLPMLGVSQECQAAQ